MQRFSAWMAILLTLGVHAAETPSSGSKPDARGGTNEVLFDGKSLKGWAITDFAGHGEVRVEDGALVLLQGYLTGVQWTNAVPAGNYELSLEARRVSGDDFFCGLTFPIGGTNVTLIVGGWGGSVVGISSLDGYDASENETTRFMTLLKGKWYSIKVRVTPGKLEAWLDEEKVVDVKTEGRKLGLRSGPIEESVPLGIATYETTSHIRNIVLKRLE
jgi:hypothetical protein